MLLSLLSLGTALGATWTVADDGSGDFSSVQAAVSAASDGDTVEVAAGRYDECVEVLGRSLVLVGAGADDTVIDGGSRCDAALVVSGGAEVEASGLSLLGDGIRGVVVEASTLTLEASRIEGTGSSSLDGGGLHAAGSEVTLREVEVVDCTGLQGGGVSAGEDSTLIIEDSTFSGNTATVGGAVEVAGASGSAAWATITGSTFTDNEASSRGGALMVGYRAVVDSAGNRFEGNGLDGAEGGAAYVYLQADLSSVDDEWLDNGDPASVSSTGGAVHVYQDSSLSVEGGTFRGNAAAVGGAVYSWQGNELALVDAVFEDNVAYSQGGAVAGASTTAVTVSGTAFADNQATRGHGGDVHLLDGSELSVEAASFLRSTAEYGGASLYLEALTTRTVALSGVDWAELSVPRGYGGAAYVSEGTSLELEDFSIEGSTVLYGGGAVYAFDRVDLVLRDGRIEGCEATDGWGGAVLEYKQVASGYDTVIDGVVFADNSATHAGGAISSRWADAFEVTGATFTGNQVTDADDGSGGAVYLHEPGAPSFSATVFCDNAATEGGAVTVLSPGSADLWTNNLFAENRAERGGALYLYVAYGGELVNNTFVGNDADAGGALYLDYASPTFVNNAVTHTAGGAGLYAPDGYSGTFTDVRYGAFHDNTGGDGGGELGDLAATTGSFDADPAYVSWTAGDGCADDEPWPDVGSPLIDAGDPDRSDPDGSRSDIGAYGGSGADELDGDGDGSRRPGDCDDTDAAVHPGAEEIPDDGIDQDCDGEDATTGGDDSGGDDSGGDDSGGGDSGGGGDGGTDSGGGDDGAGDDGGTDSGGGDDGAGDDGGTDSGVGDDGGGSDDGSGDAGGGDAGGGADEPKGCSAVAGAAGAGSWLAVLLLLLGRRTERRKGSAAQGV